MRKNPSSWVIDLPPADIYWIPKEEQSLIMEALLDLERAYLEMSKDKHAPHETRESARQKLEMIREMRDEMAEE